MESPILEEWPEPIVPVQSLSDGRITAIPDCYVKPPSQRPFLVGRDDQNDGLNIPVIDLGGLTDGSGGRHEAAMGAISDACKEWGFFQVVNHGVSRGAVERMREVWRSFFDLPMEEKKMYTNSPKTYNGYGSRVGVEKGAILDWGDYFFLNLLPESAQILDKWPKVPHNLR